MLRLEVAYVYMCEHDPRRLSRLSSRWLRSTILSRSKEEKTREVKEPSVSQQSSRRGPASAQREMFRMEMASSHNYSCHTESFRDYSECCLRSHLAQCHLIKGWLAYNIGPLCCQTMRSVCRIYFNRNSCRPTELIAQVKLYLS